VKAKACLKVAAAASILVGASAGARSILDGKIFQPAPIPRSIEWGATPPPEDIRVTTEDGLVLTGYRWKPRCADHVAMVFFHGNAGNRYTAADLAAPLRRDDVDLIVASYRGYGGNGGEPSEEGLYRDAAAFIREAQASRPRKLYLFGFSLGGAVAIHSADRFKADAVVTLGAFSNLRSAAPRIVRALIPYEFDNLAKARALDAPWLLLHGTADETVRITEAEKLKAAAGDRATFVRLPGAPHNVALDQIAERIWSAVGQISLGADQAGNWLSRPARCDGD
jgi:hypothetical protein